MKILAKSALNAEQLNDRKMRGAQFIEIQLLKDFADKDKDIDYWKNIYDAVKPSVLAIHLPFLTGQDEGIHHYLKNNLSKIFFKACELAEYISMESGNAVTIVFHSSLSNQEYLFGNVLNAIYEMFKIAINNYPHIEFAIENESGLNKSWNSPGFILLSDYAYANLFLAIYLRSRLKTQRIGTALDICHLLMTKDKLAFKNRELDIPNVLQNNIHVLKLIHLNSRLGCGVGSVKHGTPIHLVNTGQLSDSLTLECIKDVFHLYGDKLITLGVFEKDINNAVNFEKDVEYLKQLDLIE